MRRMAPFARNYALAERAKRRKENPSPPLRCLAVFARNYALAKPAKRRQERDGFLCGAWRPLREIMLSQSDAKKTPAPPFALPCGLSEKLCSRQAREAPRRKACVNIFAAHGVLCERSSSSERGRRASALYGLTPEEIAIVEGKLV